jgi:hypothetical protein
LLPRGAVWSDHNIPSAVQAPSVSSSTKIIVTAFNPEHPKNRGLPKALKQDSVTWTNAQRVIALRALRPSSLGEFKTMVSICGTLG